MVIRPSPTARCSGFPTRPAGRRWSRRSRRSRGTTSTRPALSPWSAARWPPTSGRAGWCWRTRFPGCRRARCCAGSSGSGMDARLTAEQAGLRDAAARLAADLGPGSVHDLADDALAGSDLAGDGRVARLEKAVAATGWRTMRSDGATGVEAALVAEEFGRRLVDVPFLGPVLA